MYSLTNHAQSLVGWFLIATQCSGAQRAISCVTFSIASDEPFERMSHTGAR
jgi:hypothetical protein